MSEMFTELQTGTPQEADTLHQVLMRKALLASVEPKGIAPVSHRGTRRSRPGPGTPSTSNKDGGGQQHKKEHAVYRSSGNPHILPADLQGPLGELIYPNIQITEKQIRPIQSS